MPFRYLLDPLFLFCFTVYWVNRVLEAYGWSTQLAQFYLNDLICIPFFVPMMVWGMRRVGVRDHDRPPSGLEVVIPLIVWAFAFEFVLPLTPIWQGLTFADPYDVACYSGGAGASVLFWRFAYHRPGTSTTQ